MVVGDALHRHCNEQELDLSSVSLLARAAGSSGVAREQEASQKQRESAWLSSPE